MGSTLKSCVRERGKSNTSSTPSPLRNPTFYCFFVSTQIEFQKYVGYLAVNGIITVFKSIPSRSLKPGFLSQIETFESS